MRSRRRNIGRVLWAFPMLLLFGCGTPPSAYQYKVQLPMLEVEPKISPCDLKDQAGNVVQSRSCVTLLDDDYKKILVELKSACLAFGQTDQECRTACVRNECK